MRYQKTINFLDNTPNQSSKYRAKNIVEINYDLLGTYNTEQQNYIAKLNFNIKIKFMRLQ